MGAYLMLYPKARVYTFVPLGFFFTNVALPAWVMLIYWMALQVFGGLASVGVEGGGVAFWAHLGGFLAGIVLIKLFATSSRVVSHSSAHFQPRRVGWDYRR
jgi:membrane associated rhomboid family serine protease